jgi:hypothetical protein
MLKTGGKVVITPVAFSVLVPFKAPRSLGKYHPAPEEKQVYRSRVCGRHRNPVYFSRRGTKE